MYDIYIIVLHSTDHRRRRRAPGGRGNKIYKYRESSCPARPGGDRGAGWLRRCRPASGRRRCWRQQRVPAEQESQVRSRRRESLPHLRDQCGVPGIPFLSGQTHRVNTQGRLKLHLKWCNFPRFFYCYEELNSVACRQPAFFWQPEMVLQ